jgi:predicted ATPase/DNA-binding CsgD family transcriptional regulator
MAPQSPHNLPEQPNTLLGRDQELKSARKFLLSADVRLLNLTGPPGVGKTRLAIAVAESLLEAFPDGVWFIDLAPLRDPELVGSEIASTFGLAEIREETTLRSLAAYLRDRQILLLLDNFERVVEAATWVGKLLEQTSGLKILTTSRERLRLRWERMAVVPPLPLPEEPLDLRALAAISSVALFIQRATAVHPDLALSAENAPVISELCTRLDGLPLAIELAAARASVLSPAEILANMDNRFRLLGTGALDLPERHQTLKAAIDWSYESLPPAEAQFLRRLSIFSGGFTVTAAKTVAECERLGLDVLESLIALVEKSLIIRARGLAGESRFTFLDSIREYLLDRLRASGELSDARQRHASYYLQFAEQNHSEMKRENQKARFDLLESEHDNLRAALEWSVDTGKHAIGKRICAAVWNFWWLRGHIREGVGWLETFRRSGEESPVEVHLRVLQGAGTLRGWQRDYEPGRALLMQALQLAQECQDQDAIVRILGRLGWILWLNGKTEEASWLAEKLASCPSDADPWDLAHAFLSLGNLEYESGLQEMAEKAFTRSLEYFQLAQEQHGAVFVRSKLALLDQKKGNLQEAQKGMVEALEAARRSIDLYVIAYCVDDAAQLAVQRMAEQKIAQGRDLQKIARLFGAVDHWREILSMLRAPREDLGHLQLIETLQHRMGEPAYLRASIEGQSVPVEEVIDEAIKLLETNDTPSVQGKRKQEMEDISVALSQREHEVISLIAEGLSNQEIADRLFVSERTVRFHVTSIFHKLGADNRAQAVAIANRLGII